MSAMERRLVGSVAIAITLALAAIPAAGADNSVESLLKAGWQVVGYAGTCDNRSTLILFRHPTETHLVQCAATYDVLRNPRAMTHCYELH